LEQRLKIYSPIMAQIIQYQSPWLHSQSKYDNNLINIFWN